MFDDTSMSHVLALYAFVHALAGQASTTFWHCVLGDVRYLQMGEGAVCDVVNDGGRGLCF